MNVYLEATGRMVLPFGDPVAQTPIGNRPLSEWMAEAFKDAGLTLVASPNPPCLIVPDNLFCTGGALKQFVEGACGRDAVLVLKGSRLGRLVSHVQPEVEETEEGWRFPMVRFVSGQDGPIHDVVVDPEEQEIDFSVRNPYLGTDNIE